MKTAVTSSHRLIVVVAMCIANCAAADAKDNSPQYKSGKIVVPPATPDEEIRGEFSPRAAESYLENGALAWSREKKCISCHTTGTYLRWRPSLSKALGQPNSEVRDLALSAHEELVSTDAGKRMKGIYPTRAAYTAAGLAQWDTHVTGKLSDETKAALELMFELQSEDGAWGNSACWPPLESSAYHATTVAVMAAASAPDWLAAAPAEIRAKFKLAQHYLRDTTPPHDYGRLLLLWSSTHVRDLLDTEQQRKLIDMVFHHQRDDGGWSIRTFAEPEEWGNGNRSEKLRGESDFLEPVSDGHMTGLAIMVLRDAGVAASDPRIRAGVDWLLANQRLSGRWWTRSLNTDGPHFITYSGTLYALAALDRCDALPAPQ